eukprot:4803315-Ditylum_brightwellii.AAC.1
MAGEEIHPGGEGGSSWRYHGDKKKETEVQRQRQDLRKLSGTGQTKNCFPAVSKKDLPSRISIVMSSLCKEECEKPFRPKL